LNRLHPILGAWAALLAVAALQLVGNAQGIAAHRPHPLAQSASFAEVAAHLDPDPPAPNCRYGASTLSPGQLDWLRVLGAGWYSDFSAHAPPPAVTSQFAQVLFVRQKRVGCTYFDEFTISPPLTDSGLGAVVAAQPGAVWLVGNEPDRGPNPEGPNCSGLAQDDTYPEVYARAYHDAYIFIKGRDPSAQIANAGLVEVTPGRLQYLDKVWEAYRQRYGTTMPVDVWNMHLYILPEALPDGQPNGIANIALGTDPALAIRESGGNPANCGDPRYYCWAQHDSLTAFAGQVTAMRTWMKQRGQQNKPLILSEYSILYPFTNFNDPVNPTTCFLQDEYGKCFTQARVTRFMNDTFEYLESAVDPSLGYAPDQYRLIQQWMWFSVNTQAVGYVSNLVTNDLQSLTQPGRAFQSAVASHPTYVNLRLAPVSPVTAVLPAGSEATTVTLVARVANSGGRAVDAPFSVGFYADAALAQPIGSAVVAPALGGCDRQTARVSIPWGGLALGPHPFWVKVDDGDAIVESTKADNVAGSVATIYAKGIYLPFVMRN